MGLERLRAGLGAGKAKRGAKSRAWGREAKSKAGLRIELEGTSKSRAGARKAKSWKA